MYLKSVTTPPFSIMPTLAMMIRAIPCECKLMF